MAAHQSEQPHPQSQPTTRPEVSVVVPCHNERESLERLVTEIRQALEPGAAAFEIVLVDDASTDGSWTVLERLGTADRRVRGVRFSSQCGQSAAMWAGLRAARGRVLVTLDGDLQNPPAEIPRFLEALAGCDCVCGSRVAARAAGDKWVRRASSKIANSVRDYFTDDGVADAGCCFRAFRRECLDRLWFFKGAHRFLPTLLRMEGFRVTEIPISHRPRTTGHTHYGVWNRLIKSLPDLFAVRWMKSRLIRYEISATINPSEDLR